MKSGRKTLLIVALALLLTSACLDTGSNPQSAWLVAAADIADCNSSGDEATASLVQNWLLKHPAGLVAAAGDLAYETGSEQEFNNCYDPSWGVFKNNTYPAPGNHEYVSANAAPYYKYFGNRAGDPNKGYYSYEHGAWHVIVLNSNCAAIGGCDATSPEAQWLQNDLAQHQNACTLAYWHHPRFSSGQHGSDPSMQILWATLANAKTDVVLWGHDHHFERFAPMNADGERDETGTRAFVIGMGGRNHYAMPQVLANSLARNNDTFGVLELKLFAKSYEWQFIPEAGKSFSDSGSGQCH